MQGYEDANWKIQIKVTKLFEADHKQIPFIKYIILINVNFRHSKNLLESLYKNQSICRTGDTTKLFPFQFFSPVSLILHKSYTYAF